MRGGAGIDGRLGVEVENLAVGDARRGARLDPELLLQQRRALLIEVQRRGALAAARVTTHERAPGLFVERIEAEQLLGVLDRIAEGPIVFEKADKPRQNLSRALTETFAVGINPLARAVGQEVALVQTCRFLQRSTVSRQAAIGGGLEGHQVHDRAGLSAPRERARTRIDERVQPGPAFPEVVQLAAEIGQRLGVARFRPEGACDPLTRDRSAAGMEDEEGDELLLSRAWWTGERTAVGEDTEAPEQLDPHNGRSSHGSRLHDDCEAPRHGNHREASTVPRDWQQSPHSAKTLRWTRCIRP